MDAEKLRTYIRDIPDFPKPGILFRDVTPLFLVPEALRAAADALAEPFRDAGVDRVLGIEARGFLLGAPVALALGAGLGLVRKELPSAIGRGEPLGELGSGAALDAVAYSLEPSGVSEPVRVDAGWAVLESLEREPFDPAAFAQEQSSLASSPRQQKRDQFFQAYMGGVRERFDVQREPDVYRRIVG